MENYKLDFIEQPESFSGKEMDKLRGGLKEKCFIQCGCRKNYCGCKSGSKEEGYKGSVPDVPTED